jgi:hypothetical protein
MRDMSGPAQWENPELAAALDELREAEAGVATPASVEAAVLTAWDAAHAARTTARAPYFLRRAGAVAAAVLLTAGLGSLGLQLHRIEQTSSESAAGGRTLLVVGEPILRGEPVRVVRMRVPAATLTGLGVRPATGNAAAHVDVDVLVGEDGVARAIRVGR